MDVTPWQEDSCKLLTPYFFVELGISSQPLQESYRKYEFLSTHSWMKMIWEKILMFDLEITVANHAMKYPSDGNWFIMQVLFWDGLSYGHPFEAKWSANLHAGALPVRYPHSIWTEDQSERSLPPANRGGVVYNRLTKWTSNQFWFHLWQGAMRALCPSWRLLTGARCFIAPTRKIWRWTWDYATSSLCCVSTDRCIKDVFVSGQKPNRFQFFQSQLKSNTSTICSVEPTHAGGRWRLMSMALAAAPSPLHKRSWKFCTHGATPGFGSTCWHLVGSTGYTRQLCMAHWWRSWTALTYSSSIQTSAQWPLRWSVKIAVGTWSASLLRRCW